MNISPKKTLTDFLRTVVLNVKFKMWPAYVVGALGIVHIGILILMIVESYNPPY